MLFPLAAKEYYTSVHGKKQTLIHFQDFTLGIFSNDRQIHAPRLSAGLKSERKRAIGRETASTLHMQTCRR